MIRTLLLSGLALGLAPVAAAQVAVSGDWVTLGDVAPVTGDAAKMLLAPTPAAGKTLASIPAFVIEAARRSGIILAIPLDQPILVNNSATPAPVAPTAPSQNQPRSPRKHRPPRAICWTASRRLRRRRAGSSFWRATFRAAPACPQPTLNGRRRPAAPTCATRRTALDDVVGQEAKRSLRSGQAIQTSDLKPPAVMHKGEPVRLVYAAEGMRLTVEGEAQTDAAAGDPVRVLNKYSKRSIDAVATADGDALVSR